MDALSETHNSLRSKEFVKYATTPQLKNNFTHHLMKITLRFWAEVAGRPNNYMYAFMKIRNTGVVCILVAGLIGVSTFQSCYYDNEAYLYPEGPSCTDTVSTYTTGLKSIIDNQCVNCHGVGESPDLSTFTDVLAFKEGIVCRVVEGNSCSTGAIMPPDASMTACEVQAFTRWQQNGYQE
jgi:hypothetical protein